MTTPFFLLLFSVIHIIISYIHSEHIEVIYESQIINCEDYLNTGHISVKTV